MTLGQIARVVLMSKCKKINSEISQTQKYINTALNNINILDNEIAKISIDMDYLIDIDESIGVELHTGEWDCDISRYCDNETTPWFLKSGMKRIELCMKSSTDFREGIIKLKLKNHLWKNRNELKADLKKEEEKLIQLKKYTTEMVYNSWLSACRSVITIDEDIYTIPALFYITKPRHFTEGLKYIGDGTNSTLEHYFKCELNKVFSKPMYEIEREYEYLLD